MKHSVVRKFKNFKWIVSDYPDLRDLVDIFSEYGIEGIEFEGILKQDSRAKLDICKNYTYLKLNFLKYYENTDEFEINEMHNIYGKDFLITISTYPTRKLTEISTEYTEKDFDGNVEDLLYIILDKQVSKGSRMVDYIEEGITNLEKSVYSRITKESIKLIAQKRKNITVLKHNLFVNISVLESLEKFFESVSHDLSTDYNYIVDKAHKSYQEVIVLEESVEGFDSTVKALFEVKNNDIIKRISIVSFIFIPLNLIAGVFGMNVENVPFSHESVLIIFLIAFLVMTIGGYIFRRYLFD